MPFWMTMNPNLPTMSDKSRAQSIVKAMMAEDAYSQWLGIEVLDVEPGSCVLRMTVRSDMVNGFGITHGGITYGLADSALAFASNGYGKQAVSIETSISHTNKVVTGDVLTVVAEEKNRTRKTGLYHMEIRNQNNDLVGLFQGTVFVTEKDWPDFEQ